MGYTFICRYVSGGNSKDITASETSSLEAAGLDIVLVWETSGLAGTDVSDPMSQGVSDATAANSEAASVGAPSTRPIYFAVDFDANSANDTDVNAYFQGVASVIGLSRTGVYGGYYIVNELFNQGLVEWGWQTYAWSSGQWDSRAQLRQTLDNVDNGLLDADEGMVADYGQWGPGSPVGDAGGVPPSDSGTPPTPCTVTTSGQTGVCIDTSVCASMGGTSTPNYCPGPDNIECCTNVKTPDAGSSSGGSSGGGSGGGSGSGGSNSSSSSSGGASGSGSGGIGAGSSGGGSSGGGSGSSSSSGTTGSGSSSGTGANNNESFPDGPSQGGCSVGPAQEQQASSAFLAAGAVLVLAGIRRRRRFERSA
jgi:MYXO-CTERM domain-containing protein